MLTLSLNKNLSLFKAMKRLFVLLTILLFSTECFAETFCALREPSHSIGNLFPDYKSSRSLVKTISLEVKQRLQAHLPFEFHYKEFGKHTLYLVFNDTVPIGLILARPEKGRWGINEIVWALDMDYNIIGFNFQRCRCITQDEVESPDFRQFLQGQNWQSLSNTLFTDADNHHDLPGTISEEGRSLAMTVIRSAIKASLTTSLVWGEELKTLRQDSIHNLRWD